MRSITRLVTDGESSDSPEAMVCTAAIRSSGRGRLRELAGGPDTVEVGHANIHQDDIRRELVRLADGFSPSRSLADNLYLGVRCEEFDESSAHQIVVVSDHDARHSRSPV